MELLHEYLCVVLYFILDFFLSVVMPMLSCQIGLQVATMQSYGNVSEPIAILISLICMTIALAGITQFSLSLLGGSTRMIFMGILLVSNLGWTTSSILGLLETVHTWNSDPLLGQTVFGCYLASMTLSLLKISAFVYLAFSVLADAF